MFYTEEDVNPAVIAASNVFGVVGNMLSGPHVKKNIAIATKQFGKLWYGDIENSSLHEKCKILNSKIKQSVYAFEMDNDFNFKSAICIVD